MKMHQIKLAAVVATVIVVPTLNCLASAEESATVPTDPGFKASTGQINPGATEPVPFESSKVTDIPTPDEARRALLTPVSKQPSVGNVPNASRPDAQTFGGPDRKST